MDDCEFDWGDFSLSLPDEPDIGLGSSDVWPDQDLGNNNLDMLYTSPGKPERLTRPFIFKGRKRRRPEMEEDDPFQIGDLAMALDHSAEAISLAAPDLEHSDPGKAIEPNFEDQARQVELEDDYEVYQEAVFAGVAGFHRIGETIFVVREWDVAKRKITNNWLHLICATKGHDFLVACSCRRCQLWPTDCVHRLFLKEYREEKFSYSSGQEWPEIRDRAVIILREIVDEDRGINTFSVGLSNEQKRQIVLHDGSDNGSGKWTCQKCGHRQRCLHIKRAQDALQRLIHVNPDAKDERTDAETVQDLPEALSFSTDESISFQQLAPPEWATLETDGFLYERRPFGQPLPEIIPLEGDSQCLCGYDQIEAAGAIITRKAVLYGLTEAKGVDLELQKCPVCPAIRRRYIGPDGRNLGILNFNNSSLFTHELLEDYTNFCTTSETPFIAWVTSMSRRYDTRGSPFPFAADGLFRSAWFAYARLLVLENDMVCSECGPSPDQVIWDGVTIAFSKKYLNKSIAPPTRVHEESLVRESVRTKVQWQAILDPKTRAAILSSVKDPKDGDDLELHWKTFDYTIAELSNLDEDVGAVFNTVFGHESTTNVSTRRAYRRLFEQIAAEESVLQMITQPALLALSAFIEDPRKEKATELLLIPALMDVLKREFNDHAGEYKDELVGLCRWLYERVSEVFATLIKRHEGPLPDEQVLTEEPWEQTGCCYSMPQIRHRPKYPKIKWDQRYEGSAKRGGSCSKYYSQYGKNAQTGGIMAPWCTHSIAYGFHCIPVGEGRNDVFSAMVTRWPKAPDIVVYDFACALGPYCMVREPQFFANTVFAVDTFHTSGHKKCSHAAFLQTYTSVDPRLKGLNSSAAECGNGVLTRVRKAISYMAQSRAILYLRTFLCHVNRLKLIRMAKQKKAQKGTVDNFVRQ
ncbi:hypothetical protein C8J56DRAFT_1110903 [Mycena floridula]|nr:hypothetical protein C8J56DRAFT_1110903 [Mycena floridula]